MIYPKTLQLESGSDLLNSLQALATKENKLGYVLSVVGNLSIAKFQCPGKGEATTIKKSSRNNRLEWNNISKQMSSSYKSFRWRMQGMGRSPRGGDDNTKRR